MEKMDYFYELFESLPRCGPGDTESTRKAYRSLPGLPAHPLILDIGCGPGVQTLELARISRGTIIALDNHQPFLDTLMESARAEGLASRIVPKNMSMLEMDFDEGTFDVIWSEGALYFMGFQNGLRRCRELLKNRGCLAVTEVVYLQPDPPAALTRYWENEYPDIGDVNSRTVLIDHEGFQLLSHFTLPESAWLESFYVPMERELSRLRSTYQGNETALGVFEDMEKEIALYRTYSDYFGYEFFIMQRGA